MPSPTDALTRAAHLVTILNRVANRASGVPLGRPQLARECGCSVKTIGRYLSVLKTQIPLEWNAAERAFTLPRGQWRLPMVEFTLQDTLALTLLRGVVATPGLLPHRDAALLALDKAVAGLPLPLRQTLADAGRALAPGTAPRDYNAAPVISLLDASRENRTVRVDYDSRQSGRRWRAIDPYEVQPRDGVYWEVHGWCHENRRIITLALDRVYRHERTDAMFTRRQMEWDRFLAQTGVGGIRGGNPIEVNVAFAPEVAPYVLARRDWPATLSLTAHPDGGATLTGTVYGLDGLVPELLRWRRYAHVRGGAQLRTRMRDEILAMATLYTDEG